MARRRWYKGNTHTHTTYSDGDSPPEVVVDWYAEHGYDFLFLTDHNAVVPGDHLERLQRRGLAVHQGEEVTMAAVHVNGLGVTRLILPEEPGSTGSEHLVTTGKAARIRWAAREIRSQEGISTVNHPNFMWMLGAEELLAGGEFDMLEVGNGHHSVENAGDTTHLSTDVLWDCLLTSGRRVFGVASDDAHHFRNWGARWANPGRGWLQVESASPRQHDCLEALRRGAFYASSGLELLDYYQNPREISVDLAGEAATIELVGADSRVLEAVEATSARFAITSAFGPYVRVRAGDPRGKKLWMQPLFL